MLKILYIVPNLSDPAVDRRLKMFRLGGATVDVAGFNRAEDLPPLTAQSVVELGRTADGCFIQRLAQVFISRIQSEQRLAATPVDVIVARNLEMLPLATALARRWPGTSVVYESLDIHRLLLRTDWIGGAMRAAERFLAGEARALITSSPAFVREYFTPYGQSPVAPWVVENKVLTPPSRGDNPILTAAPSSPIRIGWFGALRCRRSLDHLIQAMSRLDGRYELVLRGRPALREFVDFHASVSTAAHVRFEGSYGYDELGRHYSEVHLCWAIDFFEEGQNSSWLLPNRIYEGCLHGAVPIALAGTETARFLAEREIGIILPNAEVDTIVDMLDALTPQVLHAHALAVARLPVTDLQTDQRECEDLVARLGALRLMNTPIEEAA
jgi:succinoglycan biosynthesis protein ExoL